MTRWARMVLAGLAVLGSGLACRDTVGPGSRVLRVASLSIAAPVADLIAPDGSRLEVDRGVVRITRADGSVALERAFPFPAGQQAVQVELDIPLNAPTEQFTAGIQLLNGTTLLFQTSGPLTVSFGNNNPSPQFPAPSYAGPGATVSALSLAPRDTILTFGDSVRFRSTALAGQTPVQAYFIDLTSSDPQVIVGANGFVRAPARRATITVRGAVLGTSVTDQTTLTFVPRPTLVTRTSGDAQTATVATALPQPLRVTVTAADGQGVANVPVAFAATAVGASVGQTTVRTDAAGLASTTATLGPTAGAQQFTATVTGLPAVTFSQTATAGPVTALAFTGAPPGTIRAESPFNVVVEGRDAQGNAAALPSPVTVAFGVRPGTATLTGPTSVTPVGASATFTALRASRPGTGGTLVFTAGAFSLASAPFTVTVGAPSALAVIAGTPPSSAPVAQTLADSVVYRLTDDLGVPLAAQTVSFALTGRTGSVARASASTDTAGRASPGPWTLAGLAGANELRASIGALNANVVTVTGTAGALASVAFTTPPPANVRAASPFTVVVEGRDAGGNAVTLPSPVTVAFGVRPGIATLNGVTSVTPSGSSATFTGLSASRPGTGGTLVVTAGSATGTSTPFAVAVGPVATVTLVAGTPPTSAAAGSTLADSLVWQALDDLAVPVGGATMTFGLSGQTGSIGRTSAATDSTGRASPGPWTLAATAGSNTITAAVGVVQAAGIFVTGTSGAAANVAISVGNAQSAVVNTAVATAPTVRVTDAAGNPVAGVPVTFAVAGGGGGITGATPTSDANGLASVGSWTLGTVSGANSLAATVASLTPVTFTATGTPGAATELLIVAPTGGTQVGVINQPVPTPPAVRARDQFANPVPGVTVTFAATAGGGSVTGATQVTDAAGLATVGSWILGPSPAINTLSATAGALSASFTATTAALVAEQIVIVSGGAQAVRRGVPLPQPIVVRSQTATGIPVPNTRLLYTVTGPRGDQLAGLGGFLVTDASGTAVIDPFVVSDEPGFYGVSVIAGAAQAFDQVRVSGEATVVAPGQTTTFTVAAGAPLPAALAVTAFDESGLQVPDAPIVFTVSAPDAVPPASQITGTILVRRTTSVGVALLGGTAPTVPGRYLVRAGVSGTQNTIFVLNVTGAASGLERLLTVQSGDGTRAAAGALLPTLPTVLVSDALGGVVAGATVNFQRVDPTGATTSAGTAVTDADGVAVLPGPVTLSPTPGLTLFVASTSGAAPLSLSAFGWGAPSVVAGTVSPVLGPQVVGTSRNATVQVLDAAGIGVPGVVVTVTSTQPGPTGSPVTLPVRTVTSTEGGVATLPFAIGAIPGLNTISFAVGSLTFTYSAQGSAP